MKRHSLSIDVGPGEKRQIVREREKKKSIFIYEQRKNREKGMIECEWPSQLRVKGALVPVL